MVIKVQIEGIEQELSTLSESWVHEQIKRRQKDGVPVCVRVFIQHDNVDIALSSGDCTKGGGGGRQANAKENRIFDLWEKLHLNSSPINSGNLIGFLKQISSLYR